MKRYHVASFLEEINWSSVEVLTIDSYPWYESGVKQTTYVQLAKFNDALHIKVKAMDRHSSASVLTSNGSVYLDSCFEFFFTPNSRLQTSYFNLEVNCIGTVYLAVRDQRGKRRATKEQIGVVTAESSLGQGKVKSLSLKDEFWCLDIVIPFDLVADMYTDQVDWDKWYCNFYRCGGKVDDQYATWNSVNTPVPDFHQPLQFGELCFT